MQAKLNLGLLLRIRVPVQPNSTSSSILALLSATPARRSAVPTHHVVTPIIRRVLSSPICSILLGLSPNSALAPALGLQLVLRLGSYAGRCMELLAAL